MEQTDKNTERLRKLIDEAPRAKLIEFIMDKVMSTDEVKERVFEFIGYEPREGEWR